MSKKDLMFGQSRSKILVLYCLCAALFVPISIEYFGDTEVPRSTKVAFFTLATGLLAAGVRLIIEVLRSPKP